MSVERWHALVTTGRREEADHASYARVLAQAEGLPFVPRRGQSIEALIERASRELGQAFNAALVAGEDGLTLHFDGMQFRYHPGMGVNRIRQLRLGREDWMVAAMGLEPGDDLLDATLGLGSDLLVGSFVVGPHGRAVGVESEKLLALMVREGTSRYVHEVDEVTRSLRRIEVVHADYRAYLGGLPDKCFDVVYFDPMFREPIAASTHMTPIRRLANPAPLDLESLRQACRVARRRVVVKDTRGGPYASSGWFARVVGGPKSRIAYCVAEPGAPAEGA